MVQTRSATRIKSGQVDDNGGVLPRNITVELPPDDDPPAKRRRRQGARASKKSRRGKPRDLIQLNLDVLHLIAEYIHPLDLYNLARTCKSLRRLLMDKSSEFVWKAARRQFKGMPDCPTDLSEPAYANLAFYARCHACGKYAAAIYWYIRRRYCPACRVEWLCDAYHCPAVIRDVISDIGEYILIEKSYSKLFDRELVDSVVQEYERSSNKEQFLNDKTGQFRTISQHAKACERWQKRVALERKNEQKARREERDRSILERLKQLGYEREINYFGCHHFQEPRKKPFKPLTDREWARILPQWLETMDRHRQQWLDEVVYQPRRWALATGYETYVMQQSLTTPTSAFDLLPHVIDLACFPPFRDIIEAPEETQMGEDPFACAFAQLPVLANEWRKQLDAELAELVNIPPCLSSEDASRIMGVASNNTCRAEVLQTDSDKLQLACALFHVHHDTRIFTHPEIFSVSMTHHSYPSLPLNRTGSIRARYDILFLEEAPYIVHACELDPNVATVDDMDRRNARLRCLACNMPNPIVMNWKNAMLHAFLHRTLPPVSMSQRWQLISDEYIDMIQAIEGSINRKVYSYRSERCLLCLPCVGDAMNPNETAVHLRNCHGVSADDVKQGVHYVRLGIHDVHSNKVEMVEKEGGVIFRSAPYWKSF